MYNRESVFGCSPFTFAGQSVWSVLFLYIRRGQIIEEKILSMYAKGMTTGDIEAHIQDIYGLSVSDTTVSRITDKILPVAKEWQQRPLESIYAVVFLDAIHYHVRSEGQIVKKVVYIAIGLDLDGHKDVLGMWVGENESAKFWATVLNV